MEKKKLKKINIKNIFKITIDTEVKSKWTEKQEKWKKRGIKLKSLFSKNLKTISRIDDFRRKFLMSYWRRKAAERKKCELCGEKWHIEHIFNECTVVEKWENKIYGEKRKNGTYKNNSKRRIRIESMFDGKSVDHTFSWIYNWCIWKTYWEVVFKKFEKFEKVDNQVQVLTKHLKFFEHLHLMFSNFIRSKNHTLDTVSTQTEQFHFYSLEICKNKNGKVGNQVVSKRGSKNCISQKVKTN